MRFGVVLLLLCSFACQSPRANNASPQVQIAGAMKNVMWQGKLGGIIQLDSLVNQPGMYGIGPLAYLRGEILLKDSKAYVSKVLADSSMQVFQDPEATAPFFVYAQNTDWEDQPLPDTIHDLQDLESYLDHLQSAETEPFVFKLIGQVSEAQIHIQNLPPGSVVSSPAEAHQGQVNYQLANELVEIVGFFSRQHQGVFTHHDTYLHMHLITQDEQKMGHLDAARLGEMRLYLPR
ncbi:MAG: acetolactate decarboxylase [Bacteroidota bacterium]